MHADTYVDPGLLNLAYSTDYSGVTSLKAKDAL